MAAVNAIERVERKKNNKQEELIKSVVYKEESDEIPELFLGKDETEETSDNMQPKLI